MLALAMEQRQVWLVGPGIVLVFQQQQKKSSSIARLFFDMGTGSAP